MKTKRLAKPSTGIDHSDFDIFNTGNVLLAEMYKEVLQWRGKKISLKKFKLFQKFQGIDGYSAYLNPRNQKDGLPLLVVTFPLKATQREKREWLKKTEGHFKDLFSKNEFNIETQKFHVKIFNKEKSPFGKETGIKEYTLNRNKWIKKRYKQLRSKRYTEYKCYDMIRDELSKKRPELFGTWSGKKRKPLLLNSFTIKKIVHTPTVLKLPPKR